jgi:hypothetical protein
MHDAYESSDRTAAEMILFALGFTGFVLGATGIVVGSPATAVFGGLLLLFCVSAFLLRTED